MDPFTLSALLGFGGNLFGGLYGGQQQQEQQQLSEQQFGQQLGQQQAMAGLQATQMDPFTQSRSRQQQALLGGLVNNWSPVTYDREGGFSGGVNWQNVLGALQPFTGPSAMAGQEQAFQNTAQGASPSYDIPNYLNTGYQLGQGGLGADTPIGAKSERYADFEQQAPGHGAAVAQMRQNPFFGEQMGNAADSMRAKLSAALAGSGQDRPTLGRAPGPPQGNPRAQLGQMLSQTPGGQGANPNDWRSRIRTMGGF